MKRESIAGSSAGLPRAERNAAIEEARERLMAFFAPRQAEAAGSKITRALGLERALLWRTPNR